MTRLIVAAIASIGLIVFLTIVVSRLISSRRRGLSVRMQIFLALAGIVGAFSLGLGILVVDRIEARAERLALAAARDEAYAIAAILQSEMKRAEVPLSVLANELSQLSSDSDNDRSDRSTAGSEMGKLGIELLTPNRIPLFPAERPSRANEKGAVYVDASILHNGKVAGVVRVVKPTIVIQAMLADFAPTVLVISLILGAAAAGAAAWIGRTIAMPIESLSDYSQRVSAGERPGVPVQVVGREVARLVESIDSMRKRLEGRPFVETFAADLSHELKNPVAAIRASAEVLLDDALDEPEQARRFVQRIHEAAERIEKLLAELLTLAQVETRGAQHLEKIRFASLCEEVLLGYSDNHRKRIHLEKRGDPLTKGDKLWLARALTNLIDNSLVHSHDDSQVEITIDTFETNLIFSIDNEGSLDQHLQNSLFRRFVTTRRDKGGTGLGLSIVRAVAEAHGGRVQLLQAGPPRVSFRFYLPLA